jgi:hypothetical protein
MAMGFSDTFKKIREVVEPQQSQASALGGLGGFLQSPLGRKVVGGGNKNRTARALAGGFDPGGSIAGTVVNPEQRDKFRTKAKEFFRGKDERPPPVGAKPGQGAGNIAAKQQARARAIAAARGRFGIGDTIATSPLGLTGDGAALGKKRLIGE